MINDVDKLTAASILAGDSSLGLESIAIILKRIVSTWHYKTKTRFIIRARKALHYHHPPKEHKYKEHKYIAHFELHIHSLIIQYMTV